MVFNLFNYLLLNNPKEQYDLRSIYNAILLKVNLIIEDIKSLINNLKNNTNSIFPVGSNYLYYELKLLTSSICLSLYKLTNNIVYRVKAEDILINRTIVTLDVYFFYLSVFLKKFECKSTDIVSFINEITSIQNFSYKVDIGYCLQFGTEIEESEKKPTDNICEVLLR